MNKELRHVVRNWSRSLPNSRIIKELNGLAQVIENPDSGTMPWERGEDS